MDYYFTLQVVSKNKTLEFKEMNKSKHTGCNGSPGNFSGISNFGDWAF